MEKIFLALFKNEGILPMQSTEMESLATQASKADPYDLKTQIKQKKKKKETQYQIYLLYFIVLFLLVLLTSLSPWPHCVIVKASSQPPVVLSRNFEYISSLGH